jgi:hypothetical protein
MHDAIDQHETVGVTVENQITVAVEAAHFGLQLKMTMAREWLGAQALDFILKASEDGGRLAGAIERDKIPNGFEIGTAAERVAQPRHDSGTLLQAGAATAFDVIEKRAVFSSGFDFDVATFVVIADAFIDGGAEAGELLLLHGLVLGEIDQQVRAVGNGELAGGGFDRGDGGHGGKVGATSGDDKRDFWTAEGAKRAEGF